MNSNMSPIDWAKRPLRKYADFTGRAPRPEFWWWVLAITILSVLASILDSLLGMKVFANYGPIGLVVVLGLVVPNLAVSVRRLHDTDHSGWWLLVAVVPYVLAIALGGAAMMGNRDPYAASGAGLGIAGLLMIVCLIGAIVLIVFYCKAGTPGENRFGPPPGASVE